MKNSKIFFFNFIFFLIIILVFEVFFGHWFEENYFDGHMRGKRNQITTYEKVINGEKVNWKVSRDNYGFREDFQHNFKYDLSKIKVVFNGGSTGEEIDKEYNDTIVGLVNLYLKQDGHNIKIFNASLSGKSLNGYIYDFKNWFTKLNSFEPKIIIYYVGINDRNLVINSGWQDNNEIKKGTDFIISEISQKSFIWKVMKTINDVYFKDVDKDYFKKSSFDGINLDDYDFYNYEKAKILFNFPKLDRDKKIVKNYEKKLDKLKTILSNKKITPIFIPQINYQGNGDKILFYLNEKLKNFSIKNNYYYIPLNEMIKNEEFQNKFIDEVHTTKEGSLYIAQLLYPHIRSILVKTLYE